MNAKQLEQFKLNYAELIVDGMDMDTLVTFAIESIEQNIKDWDEDDVKSEILDYYGEETLMDLMPEQSQPMTEIGALKQLQTIMEFPVGNVFQNDWNRGTYRELKAILNELPERYLDQTATILLEDSDEYVNWFY